MKLCKICNLEKLVFPKNRKSCLDCHKASQRAAYHTNSEQRLSKVKEYYLANHQQKLDYATNYRRENAAAIKEYKQLHANEIALSWAEYYEENKLILLENGRKYTKANPDKMNAKNAKRRAKKLQRTPKWLTAQDIEKINEYYFYASLLSKVAGVPYEVDHIIPLVGKNISGLHIPENLQILTKEKHQKKGNKFPYKVI